MPESEFATRQSPEWSCRVDNATEIDLSSSEFGPFAWRLAYQRSFDGRQSQSVGQDALAIRASQTRFAFALCDGVSNSFFGEIAANILTEALVDWLWSNDDGAPDAEAIHQRLESHLLEIAKRAQSLVDQADPRRAIVMARASAGRDLADA